MSVKNIADVLNLTYALRAAIEEAHAASNAMRADYELLVHELKRHIRELIAERNHLLAQLDQVDDDD